MEPEVRDRIQKCAEDGRIRLKTHAFIRSVERRIKINEIEEALINSKIIASYPDDTPLKSYLLLGYTLNERPLHIVTAIDNTEHYIWIITVYEPDRNKWNRSLTKRREKQ